MKKLIFCTVITLALLLLGGTLGCPSPVSTPVPKPTSATPNPTTAFTPASATPKPTAALTPASPAQENTNRGWALLNEGKYDEAIAEFDTAIKLDPEYFYAYSFRGFAYSKKGQYDLAIADYSKAIELDPKNANAYLNRAFAYYNNKQYDLAIADYNKAIELDPKNANAYLNRGLAYYYKGQYALAIADYNKVIELDPKNANAWNNKGVALNKLSRSAEAMESYTRALQIDPSHESAKSNKASLMARSDGLRSEKTPLYPEAKLVLEDAINYTGSYPAPSAVSYTSSDGQSRTVNAYPGHVQVFFNTSIGKAYALGAIQVRNGTVLGQIPFLGYYLVGVTAGSEGDFISWILRDKWVNLALPNIPATASQGEILLDESWITGTKVVPLNVQPGIILLDYFVGQDHGQNVITSVDQNGGSVGSAIQIGIGSSGETTADKVAIAIAAAVAGNNIFNPGQSTLINLSSAGGVDEKDYTLLSPDKQKMQQESWENFIRGVLTEVAALPPSLSDNLVLTNSAGNGNMPISELLADLRSYPNLKDVIENNFLTVGTTLTGTSTKEFPTGSFSNYAFGDPDMAIMNNKMAVEGTSFAAPAALAIIQQVMNQTGVSSRQALEAAKLAVKNNPNHELNLKEAIGQANLIKKQ
ncbi:MAG: tetratricopeptide repeat protein, partial [Dehalococcoidia bacterium]|nr:tetratricopeptide repeat protein [Dehalococcoidia bacterium]